VVIEEPFMAFQRRQGWRWPQGLQRWLSSSGIAQKIGWGYTLVVGIAIAGTATGLGIGNHLQSQASREFEQADRQEQLLSELERSVLAMQSHPQRLFAVLEDSIWFDYETSRFRQQTRTVLQLTEALTEFVALTEEKQALEDSDFIQLINGYQQATQRYIAQVTALWAVMHPNQLGQQGITAARQQGFELISTPGAEQLQAEFEQLAEDLKQGIRIASAQKEQAFRQLERAESLRLGIIWLSMGLSIGAAIAAAIYLSRAIARPIQAVTQVAEAVTQQTDFELRVTVNPRGSDEVISLSQSLNQLIHWVGDYTHQLEQARNTLEQRVEERTRALTESIAELKRTQLQLVQSEKMSSLGQLVAGVAHEINNPTNFVYGNLKHAADYTQHLLTILGLYEALYPDPDEGILEAADDADLDFIKEDLPKLLDSMRVGAERIREIVQSLRNFSRLDEAESKYVNVHEGLDSTLMILHNRLKAKSDFPGITVVKNYGDLPLVECFPGPLNQVYMNILSNAIDALEEAYRANPEQAPSITLTTDKLPDQQIAIGIADNGPGIPEHLQAHLFDPFFTTKAVGKGTGLGLSISYQIVVERHGGQLMCESTPQRGTQFIIRIPVHQPVATNLTQH
jgi:signal transduction histidine kinase